MSDPFPLTTKAISGMIIHDCNCVNAEEWHKNLLEGCNDVAVRLSQVMDILKKSEADLPLSQRLRLVGVSEYTLAPATVKTVG